MKGRNDGYEQYWKKKQVERQKKTCLCRQAHEPRGKEKLSSSNHSDATYLALSPFRRGMATSPVRDVHQHAFNLFIDIARRHSFCTLSLFVDRPLRLERKRKEDPAVYVVHFLICSSCCLVWGRTSPLSRMFKDGIGIRNNKPPEIKQ